LPQNLFVKTIFSNASLRLIGIGEIEHCSKGKLAAYVSCTCLGSLGSVTTTLIILVTVLPRIQDKCIFSITRVTRLNCFANWVTQCDFLKICSSQKKCQRFGLLFECSKHLSSMKQPDTQAIFRNLQFK